MLCVKMLIAVMFYFATYNYYTDISNIMVSSKRNDCSCFHSVSVEGLPL